MEQKYLENPYIQHYLEEYDRALAQHRDAMERQDSAAAKLATAAIISNGNGIINRCAKIDRGDGMSRNGRGGWNPPTPPKAVRIVPEEVKAE